MKGTCAGCGGTRHVRQLLCQRCWFAVPDGLRRAWGKARNEFERRIAARRILTAARDTRERQAVGERLEA